MSDELNTETGWLIEREGPTWMFVREDRQIDWTSDSVKAVRFSRKEDAEAILFALQLHGIVSYVSEHRWGL